MLFSPGTTKNSGIPFLSVKKSIFFSRFSIILVVTKVSSGTSLDLFSFEVANSAPAMKSSLCIRRINSFVSVGKFFSYRIKPKAATNSSTEP